jgi:peptidoglycan DL-endopeptidase CwlO
VAVGLVAAGGYLVYAGITDTPLLEGARTLLKGQALPAPSTAAGTTVYTGPPTQASFGRGAELADAAQKYIGRPYRTGGTFAGGAGGDCSGLVYRALHDLGYGTARLVSWQYLTVRWAHNIGRQEIRTGDLCCYAGHVGIAVSNTHMVEAARPGTLVRIGVIDWAPKGTNPVQGRRIDWSKVPR